MDDRAVTIHDRRGRAFAAGPPRARLISLVPSITESLFALGLRENILAVTEWCTTPADEVARKPKVGGTKNPKCSAIVALKPDLVVMNVEENRKEDVARLEAAGVPVFVTDTHTIRDAAEELRLIGALTGKAAEADALAKSFESALAEAESARTNRPRRAAYLVWKDPYMAANDDTFIADMIRAAGGENVFGAAEARYAAVSSEAIAAARPEVVILPTEPYRFTEPEAEELRKQLERLGCEARVRVGDGELLCWYGPRTPAGLRLMRELLG